MASFILLSSLIGCATTPSGVTQESMSKIKRVAVVSLTAHIFYREYTGLTIFGNEYEEYDISNWKIDEEYEAQIQNVLKNLGLFDVIKVPIERADFYAVHDLPDVPWYLDATYLENWGAVEDKIKAFAKTNELDAVIFVIKRKSYDFLHNSNQLFQGAGFYSYGIGSYTRESVLHLLSKVVLIDGQTGKPVSSQELRREFHGNKLSKYIGIGYYDQETTPIIHVPEKLARSKFNELDEKTKEEVVNMLIELPKTAWEPTFKLLLTPNQN